MNTPFIVRRISQPSNLDHILSRRWEVIHQPTGGIIGLFRMKKTATTAADWFKGKVPDDAVCSNSVEVFTTASKKAGWIAKYEELRRMEATA